jgi:small-conductance mechanosensitive channel
MPLASIEALLAANANLFWAITAVAIGVVAGYAVLLVSARLLHALGVDGAVEGTSFDRTVRKIGTTTVSLLSQLLAWFVVLGAVIVAIQLSGFRGADALITTLVRFIPRLFVASIVLIAGIIVGDKVELLLGERLRSTKFPPADLLPPAVRLSIVFLAALVALGHLGLATGALLVLLGGYLRGVVVLGTVTFRDLLASGAAGTYLLLREPYTIGDEVLIDDNRGIVQEVGLFVTHVEGDEAEFVLPNRLVFRTGVVRFRDD